MWTHWPQVRQYGSASSSSSTPSVAAVRITETRASSAATWPRTLCPVVPLVAECAADILAKDDDLARQKRGGRGVDLPSVGALDRLVRGVAVIPHDRGWSGHACGVHPGCVEPGS